MCGYDPFYWYEYDLDNEYKERMSDGVGTVDGQGTGIDDIRIQKRDQKSENVKKVVRRT